MKKVDIAIPVLFVLALIAIYFFWGCKLDLYVTILAMLVAFVTGLTTYMQHKKIDELEEMREAK